MSKTHRAMTVAGVLLFGVGVIHIALPAAAERFINRTLQSLPDYTGRVEDVDLALLRAAIRLDNLQIIHRKEDMALTIKEIDARLKWGPLLRGQVVANVRVESPRLRLLVQAPAEAVPETKEKVKDADAAVKAKTGQSLPDLLAGLIPFRVDEFLLRDGTVRLREKSGDIRRQSETDKNTGARDEREDVPEAGNEARLTDLHVRVTNLTNSKRLSGTMIADSHVTAKIMGEAPLRIDFKLNPVAKPPTFDLNMAIEKFRLADLNPLFRWQAGIDVEKGTFALFSEVASAEGRFKGYVKPMVENLDVFDLKKDKKKPLKVIKEVVVDAVAALFENEEKQRVAARIPFEGRYDNPEVGIWEAVLTVFKNAFVEALKPSLEKTIDLEHV